MFDPASVGFSGPLRPHVDGFSEALGRVGYPDSTVAELVRLAAGFSAWLERRSLHCVQITDDRVAAFARHRRRQGFSRYVSPSSLRPLLGYLREIGAAPAAAQRPAISSATDRLLRDYTEYLHRTRGLVPSTIRWYADFARHFLATQRAGNQRRWAEFRAAQITSFVLREARRWSVKHVQHEVTALRSLLRYLHASGRISKELAGCVPTVAGWRLAGLPKGLEPDQVRRALKTCDPQSRTGRRAAAILPLMVRLGLRAGDVAALTLEDLDWRAAEVVLRGKSGRESRLVIPRDIGRALAAYLRDRPRTSSRRVFLRVHAPQDPLTTGGVLQVVRSTLLRAGIIGGGHLLRHTAATQMLRHGASLPEIAQVLRHRHIDTTAIYAKVDFAALRTVVQPWPGGAA